MSGTWNQAGGKKRNSKSLAETVSNRKFWFLLFSLYRVSRCHIVTGNVTFLSCVDGTGLPPVTFPKERTILKMRSFFYTKKAQEKKILLLLYKNGKAFRDKDEQGHFTRHPAASESNHLYGGRVWPWVKVIFNSSPTNYFKLPCFAYISSVM